MNTQPLSPADVTPVLYPAEFIEPGGCWIVCGSCGCNKRAEFYVETEAPWCFEPICDCPLPAVFTA